MSQFDAIYDNPNICKLEEKLDVIPGEPSDKPGFHNYVGKYPLQPPLDGARGVYGGEFVAQGTYAAWASVPDPEMSPHSLHSYFVKAGSSESPIRWEVQEISNTRNYANRLCHGYQSHTGKLCFTLQVSFVRNNNATRRNELGHRDGVQPLQIQRKPQAFFNKYKDRLESEPYFEHTHGLMQNYIPREFLQTDYNIDLKTRGNVEFGFFTKVNDNLDVAHNPVKAKITSMLFLSDSFWLATLAKALGLPIAGHHFDTVNYFRVSLDHQVYIHDTEFDPSQWMFIDYNFSTMRNDRVLCHCQYYTLEGKMVASVVQEALVYLGEKIIRSAQTHFGPEPTKPTTAKL
ncbi:hypothetical protein DIURU_004256 [Diutina rugosa]|uniref:Acyl-CoA thioesterase II n=1 Tax=Diutina rugosa TaxID=5481 RepID=A0A642UIH1_DIURU|nr:uncharacterized protein DIURU_004256 [Diutina rugosa]KAA8899589.1 hypothetical protein DIURU_004256 [Diutina rugosa]